MRTRMNSLKNFADATGTKEISLLLPDKLVFFLTQITYFHLPE